MGQTETGTKLEIQKTVFVTSSLKKLRRTYYVFVLACHSQVDLCDSGKKREQNPPGIGQDIISPELKVFSPKK